MKKEKINSGCIKIFKMLNLLYEDRAYYDDVVEIFKDEVVEQSTNNLQVILNKNINTLKVFGIKINKRRNKFVLDSSLYSLKYSIGDLKAISILSDAIKNYPDDDLILDVRDFLDNIMLRMNNSDRNTLNEFTSKYNFSFFYSDIKEQIKQCQDACKENHVARLVYQKRGKKTQCRCVPKEVVFDTKKASLIFYDLDKKEKFSVPLSKIMSINLMPNVANPIESRITVIFKLKNRLSKTYKLKPGEYIDKVEQDGSIIVVSRVDNTEKLLSRLMRYGPNCEIMTPKSLRAKIKTLINETLERYK